MKKKIISTQRRCRTCGKLFKVKGAARFCSEKCRREDKIVSYMDKYGIDRKTAVEWIEAEKALAFAHNHGAPIGWRCHDCGKACPTYRCPACKEKWLKKNGISVSSTAEEAWA